jgi:nucleotide-binding universal stress UspA family protein
MGMLAVGQERVVLSKAERVILVYVDESKESRKVVEAAAQIAKEEGASVALVTVIKRRSRIPDDFVRFVETERFTDPPLYLYYNYLGESVMAPYKEILERAGVPYEVYVEVGDVRERVEALARTLRPYRVVISMGSVKTRSPLLSLLLKPLPAINVDCPITIIP